MRIVEQKIAMLGMMDGHTINLLKFELLADIENYNTSVLVKMLSYASKTCHKTAVHVCFTTFSLGLVHAGMCLKRS
jgi:hypothetical protein